MNDQKISWEEEMRKNFAFYIQDLEPQKLPVGYDFTHIADWWLSLLHQQKSELREEIQNLIKTSGKSIEYESACYDFLELLANKEI